MPEENEHGQIIYGNRSGGSVLLHRGYKYHKNKQRGYNIYWRCWRQECRASLKTDAFDLNEVRNDIVVRDLREHQHELDDEVIRNQVFINDIKSQIEHDLTAPVKRIYNRQVAQVHRQGGGD